jgi:hypothetical protein
MKKQRRPWYRRVLSGLLAAVRGVLWSALLALLLAAGAVYILAQAMFTPEKLTPLLAGELSGVIHRTVRIESARLVPPQGIRVSGLRVLEREGFGGPVFLTCSTFVAKPDWAALARGKIVIRKVLLYSPTIQVVRSSTGAWNIADLLHGGGAALDIEQAQIEDGYLLFRDEVDGTTREASGVRFKLDHPSAAGPVPFTFGTDIKQVRDERTLTGKLDVQGTVDGILGAPSDFKMEIRKLHARIEDLDFWAIGRVKDRSEPTVDLDWTTGALNPATLSSLVPALSKARLPRMAGRLSVTYADHKRLEVRTLSAQAGNVTVHGYASFNLSVSPPTLKIRLSTGRGSLSEAAKLWTPLAAYGLDGEGQVALTVSGPVDDVSLDRISLSLRQADGHWTDVKLSDVSLEFLGEENLETAKLKVDGGSVEHAGQKLDGVKGRLKLEGSELKAEAFSALLNGYHVSAKARIVQPFAPKLIVSDGKLDRLQLEQLIHWIDYMIERGKKKKGPTDPSRLAGLGWLHIFKRSLPGEFPALKGNIAAKDLLHANVVGKDLILNYDLENVTRGLKELRGQVELDVRNGKVIDLTTLEKNTFLRYVFLPFMTVHKLYDMGYFHPESQNDLPFERIHGNYRFTKGSMLIDHFFVQGPEITATAEGEIDWAEERLLLHVVTRINRYSTGAPESLSDEKGRPTLAFFVEGPMLNPEIRLDLTKVAAGEIERFQDASDSEGKIRIKKLQKEMW